LGAAGTAGAAASGGGAGTEGKEGASKLGISIFGISGNLGISNLGAEKEGILGTEKDGISGKSGILGVSTLGAAKEERGLGFSVLTEGAASGAFPASLSPKKELKGSLSETAGVGKAIRLEDVFAAFSYCLTVSDCLARKFLSISSYESDSANAGEAFKVIKRAKETEVICVMI
jgi:hypothetical protein